MFPRDTFDGFKLHDEIRIFQKVQGIRSAVTTIISERKNPWIDLHNGTVHDALTLADWELKIPQYGCQCKRFYADWKADNQPDFSSPEAFFAWGVRLHNAVNAKLNKPEITLDEAYSIWRSTDARKSQDSGEIVS